MCRSKKSKSKENPNDTKNMKPVTYKYFHLLMFCGHLRNLCAITTTMLLGGCVAPRDSAENDSYDEWKQLAEDSAWTGPPAPVFGFPSMRDFHKEWAAETVLESSGPQPLPQIAVKDMILTREMDVGVLLRALADAADLNTIISNDVGGPILVSLRRETRWDQLFLAIIEARGLHYELENDLLQIFSVKDLEGKIAMEQALYSQLQAAEKRMRSEPMGIEMVRVHYADINNLADSIRATMQANIAAQDLTSETPTPEMQNSRFMINADKDTGQLIMHGIPSDIARARHLIKGLDQPTYQILIEATIVQANNEVARQLGVQWGLFTNTSEFTAGITPRADGFNSNFPAGFSPAGSGFTFGLSQISGNDVLQAQLSALQKDGRLNIVSRPSITTLDQLPAIIESGEERPFSSSAGSGIGTVSQIEFKKAVLRLEVTPHVIDKNWVKLKIDTNKDEFDDTRSIVIDGNVQVPVLTRSANTSLYLANGQTTVIGGLSSTTNSLQEEGIPILKDLPGVGGAFRNSANRDAFSDTLIFITPHILPHSGKTAARQAK